MRMTHPINFQKQHTTTKTMNAHKSTPPLPGMPSYAHFEEHSNLLALAYRRSLECRFVSGGSEEDASMPPYDPLADKESSIAPLWK